MRDRSAVRSTRRPGGARRLKSATPLTTARTGASGSSLRARGQLSITVDNGAQQRNRCQHVARGEDPQALRTPRAEPAGTGTWPDRATARRDIEKWIKAYDERRLHSSLGYQTPVRREAAALLGQGMPVAAVAARRRVSAENVCGRGHRQGRGIVSASRQHRPVTLATYP